MPQCAWPQGEQMTIAAYSFLLSSSSSPTPIHYSFFLLHTWKENNDVLPIEN